MLLTITTNNWLFRWAYLFTTQDRRDWMRSTTLCALFWRAVLVTPLQVGLLSLPVIFAGFTIGVHGWRPLLEIVAVVAGVVVGLVLFLTLLEWADNRQPRESRLGSFVREGIRGIKDRYCPIVQVRQG